MMIAFILRYFFLLVILKIPRLCGLLVGGVALGI
jgi:hypothetical protein